VVSRCARAKKREGLARRWRRPRPIKRSSLRHSGFGSNALKHIQPGYLRGTCDAFVRPTAVAAALYLPVHPERSRGLVRKQRRSAKSIPLYLLVHPERSRGHLGRLHELRPQLLAHCAKAKTKRRRHTASRRRPWEWGGPLEAVNGMRGHRGAMAWARGQEVGPLDSLTGTKYPSHARPRVCVRTATSNVPRAAGAAVRLDAGRHLPERRPGHDTSL
jgi:hypothetical protein